MSLLVTRVYAVLVGGLALIGLFVSGHLFELMNTDAAMDLLRIVLAAYLIYAGFIAKTPAAVSGSLLTVGLVYIGAGIVGLIDSSLGGLLPSELTGFDIGFHLLTGVVALLVGARKGEHVEPSSQDTTNF